MKSLLELDTTAAQSFEKPERRKKRRTRPKVLSGIIETRQARQVVSIEDLSLTGARIVNAPPFLELGEQIRLAIMIEGHAAHPFPCTVIHRKGNEAHLEIGLRFDPVDPGQSSGLEWYLREMQDSLVEPFGEETRA